MAAVLSVSLDNTRLDDDTFVRFVFGDAEPTDERDFRIPLQPVEAHPLIEVWRYPGKSVAGRSGAIRYVACDDYLVAGIEVPDETDGLRAASCAVYDELLATIRDRGYPHIVKAWNYMAGINDGEGDEERYKQFCLGRAESLDRQLSPDVPIPAGTAIGARSGEPLSVIVLAARRPATAVENPRQVSAYRYPREYGPRSPSFSRAALIHNRRATQLFISGTAAIVGHRSRHVDDPAAQTEETLANLESLLQAATDAGNLERTPGLGGDTILRVYLKRPELAESVRRRIDPLLAQSDRAILLEGAICRRELEVEIEGVITCRG